MSVSIKIFIVARNSYCDFRVHEGYKSIKQNYNSILRKDLRKRNVFRCRQKVG